MVAEPVTLLTDYALAGVTACLAFRLRKNPTVSCRFWTLAFVALALGALLGGTYHGFRWEWLWKPTVLSVGVASFGMLAGSAYATTSGSVRRVLLVVAALKLVSYEAWMLGHDAFIFVVADTASAMLAVAALHLFRLDNPATRWILGGVAVSLIAAGIQAGRVALHEYFNHNDLYHVVQIAAMLLYYAGAKRMRDLTAPATTP
ncbi:hypothetical protein AYO46_00370 [Betaproteobacteria bacterium SCGC AG-212-J23]|nr:hypothetical protein AYO46_00370 [Betaproteobacteria bacterium SCGC AG-212-J23]